MRMRTWLWIVIHSVVIVTGLQVLRAAPGRSPGVVSSK
jgi:hypothetical protein